jgi:predicted O-linked N-acetylglucosamine transferase (SPINDLY family)
MTANSPAVRMTEDETDPSQSYAANAAQQSPLFHFAAGKRLLAMNDAHQALAALDTALSICPSFAEAWLQRGVTLEKLTRDDEAYEAFAQALILTPGYAEARGRLFLLASRIGRSNSILTPWPDQPRPNMVSRAKRTLKRLLGLRDKPRPSESDENKIRERLLANPQSAEWASELGGCLVIQGRTAEAECFLRYALALAPWCGEAVLWLGSIFEELPEGTTAYRNLIARALAAGAVDDRLWPMALWHNLLHADWKDYERLYAQCLRAVERDPGASMPFMLQSLVDDARLHKRCAEAFGRTKTAGCKAAPRLCSRAESRPLTVGYLSADFRSHACATLFAELFELHDRRKVRPLALSTWRDHGTTMRKRIRSTVDGFIDIYGVPAEVAAKVIADANVDILVDLTGYTARSQPRILAAKPAPIQINYLGYPGTLGLSEVDYVIVDPIVAPDESAFTEALVYMPECYQINDRKRRAAHQGNVARSEHNLPADSTVFCCFNDVRKVSPHVFCIWMRILKRVPGSVLWLLAVGNAAKANLQVAARAAGVDPERLVFAPRIPYEEHLLRYRAADLALDTHPYGSHTTGSDALWMGCPIVTYLGGSFPARVTASLVAAADLPELVGRSWAEYEDIAAKIGTDTAYSKSLRTRLASGRNTCVLFDSNKFTRRLEWAYDTMWERHCRSEAPSLIRIPVAVA